MVQAGASVLARYHVGIGKVVGASQNHEGHDLWDVQFAAGAVDTPADGIVREYMGSDLVEVVVDGEYCFTPDFSLVRFQNIGVDLANESGESINGGEYDSEDPEDICVLRYTAYAADPNFPHSLDYEHFTEIEDGSYATNIPDDIEEDAKKALLRLLVTRIADKATVRDGLDGKPEVYVSKRLLEELSWIGPDWLKNVPASGSCQGCNVDLSDAEMQEHMHRFGAENCPNCGRPLTRTAAA